MSEEDIYDAVSRVRLLEENAKLKEELEKWKKQHQTIRDERAESFLRLSRAVGGVACTEYQPEVDLEIEDRIIALKKKMREARKEAVYWRDKYEGVQPRPINKLPWEI